MRILRQKLYLDFPYQKEFEAKIQHFKKDGIVLDQTLFSPGTEEKPSDKGTLEFGDQIFQVYNVYEEAGNIVHCISNFQDKLKYGDICKGKLDWELRYYLMRAHTSQHIFSAILRNIFHCLTTFKQITVENVTIHIDKKLIVEQLNTIFQKVNEICISNNYNVIMKAINIKVGPLVKGKLQRVKQKRMVEIENIEKVSCEGLHVRNTREIGELSLISFKNGKEIKYNFKEIYNKKTSKII